jgi:hypothetical protein
LREQRGYLASKSYGLIRGHRAEFPGQPVILTTAGASPAIVRARRPGHCGHFEQYGGTVADIEEKTLIVAWQRLEETLIEANKHYLMHADGGRAAAFRQLGGINQFISAIAPDRPLLQIPLLALYLALHYLDHGVVEPMLAPNTSGRGRRPQQEAIKIRSAVAMSQLYAIGYSRKEAAKRVVNELANLGCEATPRAVSDWRDGFKSLPSGDESGEIYRTMLGNENVFIGGDTKLAPVDDGIMRTKLGQQILEALRKFVLLARLTSNPNLPKVLSKLKIGPAQT